MSNVRWSTVGTLVKNKKDKAGKPIPSGKQRSYIQVTNKEDLIEFLTKVDGKAFIDVQKKPTDEEINSASSDAAVAVLEKRQQVWESHPEWSEWKLADLVVKIEE